MFKADRFPRNTSVPHQRGLAANKLPLKLTTASFGVPKDLEGQEDFNDNEESEISGEEREPDQANTIPNS